MSIRNEQCNKVCRILDDVLANRPHERDTLIVATQRAFNAVEKKSEIIWCKDCIHWIPFAKYPHYCVIQDWVSNADDYCSRAERRQDETD